MKYLWCITAVLLLSSCAEEKATKEESVHNVYVISPTGCVTGTNREFTGVVEEKSEVSLAFKTAGQLQHIYVREGQHISKGQLLASLDASDYKLGVEALQIQYDQLKSEVERAGKLFEKKSMSANDYEKAVAGLRQLGVQLQANKNKLAYTRLYAPASGVIESVNFSPGEMVDAGTSVFTLLDMSQKSVVVDIPVSTYIQREEIEGIFCCATGNPANEYAMTILSIVPKADSNQLYRMKLGFKGENSSLTPGMNVRIRLEMKPDVKQTMTLPQSALLHKDGKDFVWVLKPDSTVSLQQIEINPLYTGSDIEILSGLSPDASVVRAGVRMLHEGEKVRVIEKPAATNFGGML